MKRNLIIILKRDNGTLCPFSTKNDNLRFVDFDTEKMTLYFFDKKPKTIRYDEINSFNLSIRSIKR